MRSTGSLLICLLLANNCDALEQDTAALRKATVALDAALVRKEGSKIRQLVRKTVRYRHSNGWTETRSEMIDNLYNGTLSYVAIQIESCEVSAKDKVGIVRSKGMYEVQMGQQKSAYHLKVVQVWNYKRGHWKLVGRTSEQLP